TARPRKDRSHGVFDRPGQAHGDSLRSSQRPRPPLAAAAVAREKSERRRRARSCARNAKHSRRQWNPARVSRDSPYVEPRKRLDVRGHRRSAHAHLGARADRARRLLTTEAALPVQRPSALVTNGSIAVMCLVWGSTWLVIREGLDDVPPFTSAAVLFLFLSPVVSAVGNILVKKYGEKTNSMAMNRNGMLLGGVVLGVVALATERSADAHWTRGAMFSVAYLAFLGTVLTFGLYFWLL